MQRIAVLVTEGTYYFKHPRLVYVLLMDDLKKIDANCVLVGESTVGRFNLDVTLSEVAEVIDYLEDVLLFTVMKDGNNPTA